MSTCISFLQASSGSLPSGLHCCCRLCCLDFQAASSGASNHSEASSGYVSPTATTSLSDKFSPVVSPSHQLNIQQQLSPVQLLRPRPIRPGSSEQVPSVTQFIAKQIEGSSSVLDHTVEWLMSILIEEQLSAERYAVQTRGRARGHGHLLALNASLFTSAIRFMERQQSPKGTVLRVTDLMVDIAWEHTQHSVRFQVGSWPSAVADNGFLLQFALHEAHTILVPLANLSILFEQTHTKLLRLCLTVVIALMSQDAPTPLCSVQSLGGNAVSTARIPTTIPTILQNVSSQRWLLSLFLVRHRSHNVRRRKTIPYFPLALKAVLSRIGFLLRCPCFSCNFMTPLSIF